VDDAQEILKSLSLKSYEGGYKIMIIWMADKLNIAASINFKNFWRSPRKTVFILISENEEELFKPYVPAVRFCIWLSEPIIAEALVHVNK
jgi:DNA polymerase-3 subunit delta'